MSKGSSLKELLEKVLGKLSPSFLFSLRYWKVYGKMLNFKHPKSFYEKVGFLEFFTDTSEMGKLADKVAVRDYVKQKGLSHLLNELYGVYHNSSEIDYDQLPNRFALKTNHGSATNIIVRDKNKLDISGANQQLDAWLKVDYGYITGQPHYSHIKPLILAEAFLDNGDNKILTDYKFWCLNGVPRFCQIMSDRVENSHAFRTMFFDMDWQPHPEYVMGAQSDCNEPKPICFDEMRFAAEKLSQGIPYVRVDFYNIKGKAVFGEMTFTPGFANNTIEFFDMLGEELDIEEYLRNNNNSK